jgi:hypothetical protein
MATGDTPNTVSRPKYDDMIVSVTRHKKSNEDNTFTCQFPLSSLKDEDDNPDGSLDEYLVWNAFSKLKTTLKSRLENPLTDMSIVWCLVESGQLAVLNNREALCAAIMDFRNAGKHAVQLYVVKKFGKIKPELRTVAHSTYS